MEFEELKGIGKSRIEKLKSAGFQNPLDLLLHFPYKYVDLRSDIDLGTLKDGDDITVNGVVTNVPRVAHIRKGLYVVKVTMNTRAGAVEASWFNQKFILSQVKQGAEIWITGKVKKFGKKVTVSAPAIIHPNGKTVLPLYRNIAGIPQKVLTEALSSVLERAKIEGYIPENIRQKHGLPSLEEAFNEVHNPVSILSAQYASKALSLEKLSYSLCVFKCVKEEQKSGKKFEYNRGDDELSCAIDSLPFELTSEQIKALWEIIDSLRGESSMNRLLQGDVGCGKTIVALLAAYFAYLNGYQSVLMAPTEILAVQHYTTAIKYFEKLGMRAVLLTGSTSKSERDEILFNIKNQAADIVIGTHALFGDEVVFRNLALIITDEQQRFGVNQRGNLENKSPNADILVMTATPIPRTLAMCTYGELNQSVIKALPKGRPEISTAVVPPNKLQSMFSYVFSKADCGEQTFIVCPRIDEDEESGLTSAVELYKQLTKQYPFYNIGLLHGRMKDSEKNAVMSDFISGKVRVLVATSVIEVGIDVPQATNIIVFNSERYGLSQLHQLRGRVGRGTVNSFCFLPTDDDVPPRIKYFCSCNDGFSLAEYDFAQRGAGDFIGTRQHGDSAELATKIDTELIMKAKEISDDTLGDPAALKRLREGIASGTVDYVRSITLN